MQVLRRGQQLFFRRNIVLRLSCWNRGADAFTDIASFQLWVASPLHGVDPIYRYLQNASREVELFQMRVSDTESLAASMVVPLSDVLNYRSVHETALICTYKYHYSMALSLIAC